jgi:hypothetical protein
MVFESLEAFRVVEVNALDDGAFHGVLLGATGPGYLT